MLSVFINNIKDVIYTSVLIYKVINVNLKFINNLNVLIIISQINAIVKLY